ncbi:MAG: MBL fold metallo-hydrolase [Melioribacteraceae bacterium]|nr:MBL fold metallo-hydrolase [Melioribacteraceae bacterium]
MIVKQFLTGGDRNFGYLAACDKTKKGIVIDPSYSPKKIYDYAVENEIEIKYIFNTHRHFDHTEGNVRIERFTGIKPLGFCDKDPRTDSPLIDDYEIELGELTVKIIHTPGHTQDSICIYIGDAVFTGDTLFVGKVGGTDLADQAHDEYHSLHKKLLRLPKETRVFPGHNYGADAESTIDKERKTNPFLIQPNLEAFIDLKRNWLDYKKKHGIT